MSPFRKGLGVSPHSNFAGVVDQLEMARDTLEFLVLLPMLNANLKKSVIGTGGIGILEAAGRKLLVRRVIGRSDVVGHQNRIRDDVSKPDELIVLDMVAHLVIVIGGDNLPVVVRVVVRITSHLLALAGNTAIVVSQWVLGIMAV